MEVDPPRHVRVSEAFLDMVSAMSGATDWFFLPDDFAALIVSFVPFLRTYNASFCCELLHSSRVHAVHVSNCDEIDQTGERM